MTSDVTVEYFIVNYTIKVFISDPDMLFMIIEALLYVNKTKWIDKIVNYIWHSPYSENFIQ